MKQDNNLQWVEYTQVNGNSTRDKERVVVEYSLSIILDGKHFASPVITPMEKREFVVGHLFGHEVIDTFDDIKSITVKEDIAEVTLHSNRTRTKQPTVVQSDFKVNKEDIYAGVNAILNSNIYEETKAAHSAGLFKRGAEPLCIVEDIGRHNALDKIIGYALINKVDIKNTFATSTGRMVSDMVNKICRAGIPIVATKTAVSNMGIRIGEKCGLTIIGFVRDIGMRLDTDDGVKIESQRGMKIYTNPQRIVC